MEQTEYKKCFKCNWVKPLSEFYKHPQMKGGRVNKCKPCNRKDVRENRADNVDYYREYDRSRGSRRDSDAVRKYRAGSPSKYKAHTRVNNAVRDGVLTRSPCEVCGSGEHIHAHHDDYLKPLDVRWLCPVHHFAWHSKHGEALNG